LYRVVLYLSIAALVSFGAVIYCFQLNSAQGKNFRYLETRDTSSGKIYGKWPLETGGEFAIEFVHSVNQSPVRELFRIDDRVIRPVAVRFSSFGAGMQSDLAEGQTLSRDGDALVITGFSSSFRELNYIVGTVSDHLLFINGETVSLRDLCGRNAHVNISVKLKK
jgi:hypothetical protein